MSHSDSNEKKNLNVKSIVAEPSTVVEVTKTPEVVKEVKIEPQSFKFQDSSFKFEMTPALQASLKDTWSAPVAKSEKPVDLTAPKETEVPKDTSFTPDKGRKKVVPKKNEHSKKEPLTYEQVRHHLAMRSHYVECLDHHIESFLIGTEGTEPRAQKYQQFAEENSKRAYVAAKNSFENFLFNWGNVASYRPNSELNPADQAEFDKRYKLLNKYASQDRKKMLQREVAYKKGVERWKARKPSSGVSTENKPSAAPKKEVVPPKEKNAKVVSSQPAKTQVEKPKPEAKPTAAIKPEAAPKKVETRNEFVSLSQWASSLKPAICKADKDAMTYAKNHGIEYRQSGSALNGHSISALERHQAMRAFLQIVGRDKKRLDICSYFGSNRDTKFIPQEDLGLSINWVCAPNDPIQGDCAREFSDRVTMPTDKMFDSIVFVDVYQSGASHLDVISPTTIKRLIGQTTSGSVYGILRKFHGLVGADVFVIQEDAKITTKVEGVWITKDNLVYFSPDSGGSSYPGHPNPTWLQQRYCDGVDIHEVQNFGPYTLFKFALSSFNAQTIDDKFLLEPKVKRSYINKELLGEAEGNLFSSVMSRIRAYCPTVLSSYLPEVVRVEVMVHTATLSSLAPEYGIKKIVGLTLDTVITKVRSLIETDRVMNAVKTRFPAVVSEIVTGTALAVLYAEKRSIADRFLVGRHLTADVEEQVDILRQPKMESRTGGWKLLGLLSLLAIGILIKKYLMLKAVATAKGDLQSSLTLIMNNLKFVLNKLSPSMVLRSVVEDTESQQVSAYFTPATGFCEWPQLQSYLEGTRSPLPLNSSQFLFICVLTPIVEEILKQNFPNLSVVLFLWETILNTSMFGFSNAILIVTMHIVTYFLGRYRYAPAMLIHGLTNFASLYISHHYTVNAENRSSRAAARLLDYLRPIAPVGSLVTILYSYLTQKPQETDAYAQFVQDYSDKRIPDETALVASIPYGSAINPVESTLYPIEAARGFIRLWMHGVEVPLCEVKTLLLGDSYETRMSHKIHPLLINNGLMYTPANSMNNLLACLLYRIHKDPFTECPPREERFVTWRKLMSSPLVKQFYKYFEALGDHEKTGYPSIEEIVAIMGPKGRRIEVCHQRLMEGEEMPPAKSYNVKWNETIPLKEVVAGVFDIKPRAICNLDPSLIALTTQLARYITTTCHLIFDGKNGFQTPFGTLKIAFASGYNQAELSKMFILMLESENFLAVAGDDSIFKANLDGIPECGEADFSAFDQSQDDGPNRIAFAIWMKKIGIDVSIIDAIIFVFAKGYKVPARNARVLSIVGSGGLQLPTGHTLTTVLNSLNNIWSFMLTWQTKPFCFQKAAARLGFTAKTKLFGSDYFQLSFLKGWWMPTNIGPVWMPLPSAVTKIGKFLKPLSYFATKRGDPIPICSAMIVNSYFGVDRSYPILGDFLKTLDRFKNRDKYESCEVNENEFKPRLMQYNYIVDKQEAQRLIMQRYGFDFSYFKEVKELYASVQTLPAYVQHPVFRILQEKDYM